LIYRALGQHTPAIEDFTKVLTQRPQETGTLLHRGQAYLLNEDFQKAAEDFTAVLQFQPEFPQAYYFRGIAYFRLAEYELALHDLSQAAPQHPQHADTYFHLGRLYAQGGNHHQAMVHFSRAAQHDSVLFIRRVQGRLKASGHDLDQVGGVLDTRTTEVLRQYQTAQELPVTGILDEATCRALLALTPPALAP
jgi:tetratricopeptide (TPR) repeat protein